VSKQLLLDCSLWNFIKNRCGLIAALRCLHVLWVLACPLPCDTFQLTLCNFERQQQELQLSKLPRDIRRGRTLTCSHAQGSTGSAPRSLTSSMCCILPSEGFLCFFHFPMRCKFHLALRQEGNVSMQSRKRSWIDRDNLAGSQQSPINASSYVLAFCHSKVPNPEDQVAASQGQKSRIPA